VKKLLRSDILGPAGWAAVRDQERRSIIELKKKRRVLVGPQVSLVFENRETMRVQVEEMCRAENLTTDEKIGDELAVYNAVLPDDGQLGATLFVEMQSEASMARTLERLVGLQEHVWLVVGGHRMKATFDPDQFKADKLAAVQYLKFPLPPEVVEALRASGTGVAVAIDHPNYRHSAQLDEEQRRELARDLD
jgi:hypothetical protein